MVESIVERYLVEKYLHIEDGIYRDSRFADVAYYSFVVGVVSPVRREVESD